MAIRLPRLAAASLMLALASLPAWAQEAQPKEIQDILTSRGIDKVHALAFRDDAGNLIGADEFLRQKAAGKVFIVMKKLHQGQDPDVTLKLTTKEAMAMMSAPGHALKAGDPFPAFKLPRLDGTVIDNAALAGRYTLVNFYFAQCAPCVQEVPELNALAKARSDINFLGVTFDSAAETAKFAADTGFKWPLLPGAAAVASGAGVKAYPSFVLLDPQGKVVEASVGAKIKGRGGSVAAWLDEKLAAAKR